MQVNNSTTLLKGNHALKAGLDLQWVGRHARVAAGAALHVPERRGVSRGAVGRATASATPASPQYFGLPNLEYNTSQYGLFVQDDWRVSSDLKVLYGLRYDLYAPPDGDAERADRDVARNSRSRRTTSRRGSARCGRSARASARCSAPTPA